MAKFKKNKYGYLIISIMCTLLLTSCGFKLRGWQHDKLDIKNLRLNYINVAHSNWNYKFISGLISNLRGNNITVTPYGFNHPDLNRSSKTKAIIDDYTLEIKSAEYTKKITSTGSNQLVAQYKLNFNAVFDLYKNNKLILSEQRINAERNYNYKQNQILGLDYEEDTITNDLIQEVTDRIINQLIVAAT